MNSDLVKRIIRFDIKYKFDPYLLYIVHRNVKAKDMIAVREKTSWVSTGIW